MTIYEFIKTDGVDLFFKAIDFISFCITLYSFKIIRDVKVIQLKYNNEAKSNSDYNLSVTPIYKSTDKLKDTL